VVDLPIKKKVELVSMMGEWTECTEIRRDGRDGTIVLTSSKKAKRRQVRGDCAEVEGSEITKVTGTRSASQW